MWTADLAETVLTAIEPENQTVGRLRAGLMFVFDDIITIDKEGIKALLAKVDRKVLTLALKGTGDKITQHFTQCMSQRSAEMLMEDMEALGPMRIRDVPAAQQRSSPSFASCRRRASIASSRGGDDEYVV